MDEGRRSRGWLKLSETINLIAGGKDVMSIEFTSEIMNNNIKNSN